ncbi:MAG TPA: DUF6498-containing protein [Thermoanaerobaculia bacterium]|nr:DUF6498-containing protein [Thermoanaerobaculia bacterium]
MKHDTPVLAIVASNLFALALALWHGWAPNLLLVPIWIQSVVIGYYAYRRILAMGRFTTAGVRVVGTVEGATDSIRREGAGSFAALYGTAHLVYAFFLLLFALPHEISSAEPGLLAMLEPATRSDLVGFLAGGVAFFLAHRHSHRAHLERDLAGPPDLGLAMLLPTVRIVPMHLTILLGFLFGDRLSAIAFLMALKTGADVLMHVLEHRWLRLGDRAPAYLLHVGRVNFTVQGRLDEGGVPAAPGSA